MIYLKIQTLESTSIIFIESVSQILSFSGIGPPSLKIMTESGIILSLERRSKMVVLPLILSSFWVVSPAF